MNVAGTALDDGSMVDLETFDALTNVNKCTTLDDISIDEAIAFVDNVIIVLVLSFGVDDVIVAIVIDCVVELGEGVADGDGERVDWEGIFVGDECIGVVGSNETVPKTNQSL